MKPTNPDIEDIEISLLIDAINRRWGYDFRDYALASLKRRIQYIVTLEKLPSISALQERILRDSAYMRRFIEQATVSYTSMFRDPDFYRSFRKNAVPQLQQHRLIRIWDAGCATGEEVYSLAILLLEEDLFDRVRIYATDINQTALESAKEGIYPLHKMQEYTKNYQLAGGKTAFSEYYHADYGNVTMRGELSKKIVWAQHNLISDSSFNEFHLILCRNVLIYFNPNIQARVHRLIYDSLLQPGGLMVLGRQESIQHMPFTSCYLTLDNVEKIYQRVRPYSCDQGSYD
jgi:chemotaxis protein methyltransferase CheR